MNWGHEDNTKNEFCAQMNATNDGKWDAISCNSELPYMCKYSTGKNIHQVKHWYKFRTKDIVKCNMW